MKRHKPVNLGYHPKLRADYMAAVGRLSHEHAMLLELHHAVPLSIDELCKTLRQPRRTIIELLDLARDALAREIGGVGDENLVRDTCRIRVAERSHTFLRETLQRQIAGFLAELTVGGQAPIVTPADHDVSAAELAKLFVGNGGIALTQVHRALRSLRTAGHIRRHARPGRLTIVNWQALAAIGSRRPPHVTGLVMRHAEVVLPPGLSIDLFDTPAGDRHNTGATGALR